MKRKSLWSVYSGNHGCAWWLLIGSWLWIILFYISLFYCIAYLIIKIVKCVSNGNKKTIQSSIELSENSADTEWGYLNKNLNEAIAQGQSGRNEYLGMYNTLNKEGKRNQALEFLLRIIWLDLNGNSDKLFCLEVENYKKFNMTWDAENFCFHVSIVPFVQKELKKFSDIYTDDMALKVSKRTTYPMQICDSQSFLDILHSILDDRFSDLLLRSKLYVRYINVLTSNNVKISNL